jgi:hypothetical protein
MVDGGFVQGDDIGVPQQAQEDDLAGTEHHVMMWPQRPDLLNGDEVLWADDGAGGAGRRRLTSEASRRGLTRCEVHAAVRPLTQRL